MDDMLSLVKFVQNFCPNAFFHYWARQLWQPFSVMMTRLGIVHRCTKFGLFRGALFLPKKCIFQLLAARGKPYFVLQCHAKFSLTVMRGKEYEPFWVYQPYASAFLIHRKLSIFCRAPWSITEPATTRFLRSICVIEALFRVHHRRIHFKIQYNNFEVSRSTENWWKITHFIRPSGGARCSNTIRFSVIDVSDHTAVFLKRP